MDGRQSVGRLRPRPLDWVVGEARPRWRRRADVPPPTMAGPRSLKEWLSSYWSPSLRVLEVASAASQLATEASLRDALEFVCLAPRNGPPNREEVGRLGWIGLHGDPAALARCRLKFDLIAWLREESNLAALFDDAERLLAPNGLLAVTTRNRLDGRLGARWQFSDAVPLSDGSTGIAARRRRRAKAA